jgi:hypothetical protein
MALQQLRRTPYAKIRPYEWSNVPAQLPALEVAKGCFDLRLDHEKPSAYDFGLSRCRAFDFIVYSLKYHEP